MKLTYIKWVDSFGHSGWKYLPEYKPPETLICQSVGWIIRENDSEISIVATRSEDLENIYGPMTIPRRAILSQINLAED